MERIRVLVVDDHAVMRDGIRALLEAHQDIEVVGEAGNGLEAMAMVGELSPDVVLMDMTMPVMDGLEATRRIAKKYPRTRVLVLTQQDTKDTMLAVVKSGASGFVPKIAAGAELLSAIRTVYRGDLFLDPSATKALMADYLRRLSKEEDPYERLSAREREVLKLVAEGHTNQEIAKLLGISPKTVVGHRTGAMAKLGIHNRAQLVKYAVRRGLVDLQS